MTSESNIDPRAVELAKRHPFSAAEVHTLLVDCAWDVKIAEQLLLMAQAIDRPLSKIRLALADIKRGAQ